MNLVSAVLSGCQASVFFKHFGEVALVAVTACDSDLDDRIVCVGEQALCLLHTDAVDVFLEGNAGHLPEQHGQIGRIDMKFIRHAGECNVLGKVFRDIFLCIFDQTAAPFGRLIQAVSEDLNIILNPVTDIINAV